MLPIDSLTDRVYANPLEDVGRFQFDETIARAFADMIKRSVPGYGTILSMIGDIAERYSQPHSYCYDLGCSLGAATLAMRHRIQATNCRLVAIDNSPAMVKRARAVIDAESHKIPVELFCADINDCAIERASMVVLNFTLQFIPPQRRRRLIQRIYDGLLPGGILLLSEKIVFADARHQQLMTHLYHNFKRANGYSDLEIAQKRTALEKVLRPDSLECHRRRLNAAGFHDADIWFQCFTFASMIAVKPGLSPGNSLGCREEG